jgi:hypothetical protein
MVVDMRFLVVVALFVVLAVVVAVGQRVVIVFMSMPEGPMIPLSQRITAMVVRDVVVVVAMSARRVRVLGLAAFAFGALHSHGAAPFSIPVAHIRLPSHFPCRNLVSHKTNVFGTQYAKQKGAPRAPLDLTSALTLLWRVQIGARCGPRAAARVGSAIGT